MDSNLLMQGLRLKQLLEHFRFTQQKFADQTGYKQGHISQIVKGKRAIAQNLLNIIANKYNVSIDWLLKGEGPMFMSEEFWVKWFAVGTAYLHSNLLAGVDRFSPLPKSGFGSLNKIKLVKKSHKNTTVPIGVNDSIGTFTTAFIAGRIRPKRKFGSVIVQVLHEVGGEGFGIFFGGFAEALDSGLGYFGGVGHLIHRVGVRYWPESIGIGYDGHRHGCLIDGPMRQGHLYHAY